MQHRIENVPHVTQRPNWCSYASLSMILRYWGHDISQEEVFEHIQGNLPEEELYSPDIRIGIGNIAIAAHELTGMRTDLWSEDRYERARQKKPNLQPHDVLKSYISRDIPCIVRVPNHYNVAVGFNTDADEYYFNETNGREIKKSGQRFEREWSHNDSRLVYNSSHLILAVRPD